MKITKFHIQLSKDEILRSLDCYADNSLYEEFSEEYDVCVDKVHALEKACALVVMDTIPKIAGIAEEWIGKRAVFVLLTLGDKVTQESAKLFQQGDYLSGMLINTIADYYLFHMEQEVTNYLEQICKEEQIGIERRLEIPEELPMEIQKVICTATKASELGIQVNEHYMLNPIKTMTYVYLISENTNEFRVEHNCNSCNIKDCMIKKAKSKRIRIHQEDITMNLQCFQGESIMNALQRENIPISFPCAGHGICGKCRIQVISGSIEVSREDYQFLTREEIEGEYRLACKAFPKEDCEIILAFQMETKHEVLADFYIEDEKSNKFKSEVSSERNKFCRYGIGIDIGTTTLVMQLVDMSTRTIVDTYATMNPQRKYGADVIGRMEAETKGKGRELQFAIQQSIKKGIAKLTYEQSIDKIVIVGNTTMIHLLLGFPCKTLGEYPFTPVDISRITGKGELIGMENLIAKVVIFPGISTYVGGDIVAGLMACEFHKRDTITMLIDLGTNGEMAIGNAKRIMCTSTAAGPAFEGGNISCGIGSIPGAISGVEISETIRLQTIEQEAPIGICGTGMVEIVAELLKIQAIDETGLLADEYFNNGYLLYHDEPSNTKIVVTQKDIREFQLAKAAIRSGVELLIERYQTTYEEIDKVYLAGGFGYAMNIKKAIQIGLFPAKLEEKIVPIGNAALGGTLKELFEECNGKDEEKCINVSTELELSSDKKFNELYIEHMCF